MSPYGQFIAQHYHSFVGLSLFFYFVGGATIVAIVWSETKREVIAGIIGIGAFIVGLAIGLTADNYAQKAQVLLIKNHAVADCNKFDAAPAEPLSGWTNQLYCAKFQAKRTGVENENLDPDIEFASNCFRHNGTLLKIPYKSTGEWGCGTVVAIGTRPNAASPFEFSPITNPVTGPPAGPPIEQDTGPTTR